MFNSVRSRLTLWYTTTLSLVLIIFALVTYNFISGVVLQRINSDLAEKMNAFIDFLNTEYQEKVSLANGEPVIETILEFPIKDQRFIVYTETNTIIAATPKPSIVPSYTSLIWSPKFLDNLPSLLKNMSNQESAYFDIDGEEKGINDEENDVRVFIRIFHLNKKVYKIVLLHSYGPQEELLENVRHILYVVLPAVIVLISIAGYLLVRKSLLPVVAMSEQAKRISARNLYEQLPIVNKDDELGRLATVFNELLTRLNDSFEQQKRFMADASHELRTPVAIVQGESEVALSQLERPVGEYRESLTVIYEEGKRLARIVEDLFTLVRADAGQYPLTVTSFYLDELIGECVRAVRTLATQRQITINYEVTEEMLFRGDEVLIRRLLTNLLDNAIKYTPKNGQINVEVKMGKEEFQINIADTGLGIPLEKQAHIFERFYRVDKARSRSEISNMSGAGLGLAIARWVVEAHYGRLILASSTSKGSVFTIFLPISTLRTPPVSYV